MIAVHARSVFSAQSELISKSNPTSEKLESGINAGSVDIFGGFSVDPNSTLGIDWYKEIAHDMAQNKYIFFVANYFKFRTVWIRSKISLHDDSPVIAYRTGQGSWNYIEIFFLITRNFGQNHESKLWLKFTTWVLKKRTF